MATNTKSVYIIDSSALLAHLLHEPHNNTQITIAINSFYDKKTKFIAPIILPFEIGNVLRSCVKSKRLSILEANKLYKHFLKLPIKYESLDPRLIFKLSLSSDLTYYDAAYLALKNSTHSPLLTLDKKLLALTKI